MATFLLATVGLPTSRRYIEPGMGTEAPVQNSFGCEFRIFECQNGFGTFCGYTIL